MLNQSTACSIHFIIFQCNETSWIFHYVGRSILVHRWGFKILARRCSMKGRSQCLGSWRREHVGDTFVLCWKDLQVWHAYNLIAFASMMFIFLISTRCPPTPSSNSWQNILSIYLPTYLPTYLSIYLGVFYGPPVRWSIRIWIIKVVYQYSPTNFGKMFVSPPMGSGSRFHWLYIHSNPHKTK